MDICRFLHSFPQPPVAMQECSGHCSLALHTFLEGIFKVCSYKKSCTGLIRLCIRDVYGCCTRILFPIRRAHLREGST